MDEYDLACRRGEELRQEAAEARLAGVVGSVRPETAGLIRRLVTPAATWYAGLRQDGAWPHRVAGQVGASLMAGRGR